MVPVIFLHRGNDLVYPALTQARKFNERVILLGDTTNNQHKSEFYPYLNYLDDRAERMVHAYRHMHKKPEGTVRYRLANILRWFVISNYMRTANIDTAFIADSDLLLYVNVEEVKDDWGGYDVLLGAPDYQESFRWAAPGHASFWTLEMLDLFCEFAIEQYIVKPGLERLRAKWHWHLDTGANGGVCDMTLLYLFSQRYSALVGSLLEAVLDVQGGMHAFDLNINQAENFYKDEYRMRELKDAPYGAIKYLIWNDGIPYGDSPLQTALVRFDALHFQSGAKTLVPMALRNGEG